MAFLLSSSTQMPGRRQSIPEFRADGYLPEGLYLASDAEVIFRFGASRSHYDFESERI